MVDINNIYNETRPSAGLNLDMDRLHSLEVFSIADASSTAAVDHYLEVGRGAAFGSDYTQGFSLSIFDEGRFSKSQADESSFMSAPAIDPLFFGSRDESIFDPIDIYSIGLPECPKDPDAMPEIWYPIMRFEDLEKFLEENSIEDIFQHPIMRFEDLGKMCIVYL